MSSSTTRPPLVIDSISRHTATVIFLHGLGDTGYGWEPVATMFARDSDLDHIKWILPHAPTKSVTANGGMEMPAWFDIADFGVKDVEDEAGMLDTVAAVNQLITAEVAAGTPSERVLIGGFSQGSAISVLTGLSSPRRLAGLVALSGWVPIRRTLQASVSPYADSIPIFWGHGTLDPLIRYDLGVASVQFLRSEMKIDEAHRGGTDAAGLKGITFNSYQMGHSTHPEELEDLKQWLKKVLPKGL